jgi:hypothetical protein
MKTIKLDTIFNVKLLKYSLLTVFCCFLFFTSLAQESTFKEKLNISYAIQNISTIKNSEVYINALNASNMNNHRLKSDRNTITFEGGIIVILFSAEELLANSVTDIDPSNFPNQIQRYSTPIFKLTDNNYIVELHQTIPTKH